MKLRKRTLIRLLLFFIPDIIFSVFILIIFIINGISDYRLYLFLLLILVFIMIRSITYFISTLNYYKNRVNIITGVLSDFKKGKFILSKNKIKGDDELSDVFDELTVLGKHLDSIFSAQKEEIEKFNEVYNSIIFSMKSYFVVLDESETVVFATEGFCNKFQFDLDQLIEKKIDEIFYFVNARLKGGLSQVRKSGKSIILEKTHLLSINKVSIIADIKISNIMIGGRNEVILLIDDVTSKLRKDYQISLMNQISESIQRDAEIDRVLYTILTGVTSGSGLGFNRAMLFLVESGYLVGKMAVGPDSFEEAIDIWSSIPILEKFASNDFSNGRSGENLLQMVLNSKYSVEQENIFVQSLKRKESIHIYDSWNEVSINAEIRELLDVKEFVIVPLIVGNRSIGIVIADNKFNQSSISDESVELLSIFASQAALSIESYNNLSSVKDEMEKIRQRQEAIVESEKMAAVGRIAAHIAHEIRNPLVTMGGYARRVIQLSKGTSKKSENIAKSAEIILRESERLEGTLSNVMDFTKPSKYIREFNNINDVINDTLTLLKNLILERKINVEMNLHNDLPLVKCDFNQMKQVILNLVQNCIDTTPPNGFIILSTEISSEYIIIKIQDTGAGIDEDDPDIIFEPFFTTKVTGVGLGLAIVKKIIKDHNGEIKVKNLEQGVEFEISLPVPK